MVRRNAAREVKPPKGKGKRPGRGDDDEVQQPGKLMLNNPLIPPELDEDIDDDLAFNSEDERLYGHLFENKDSLPRAKKDSKKRGKKSKLSKTAYSDSDDDEDLGGKLSALGRSEKSHIKKRGGKGGAGGSDPENDDLYNYHEDGQSSDDGEDYIDLSDMLDMSLKEQAEKTSSKKKKTEKKPVSIAEDGNAIVKKRRGVSGSDAIESLYGGAAAQSDGGTNSFGTALRQFVRTTPENKDEAVVKSRLERSLRNQHNLLGVDADEKTKTRLTRREVRGVIEEDMKKYKSVLREMNTSQHMQFPLTAPMSNPIPASIGGIVSAVQSSLREHIIDGASSSSARSPGNAARKLASKMDSLLSNAGLSAKQLYEEGRAGENDSSAFGDHVQFNGGASDGDEESPQSGPGREQTPNTSYMAKLKAMLAFENSRRKRFNKIKSKTYRRILRKEKEREKDRRQKAFELLHPELARKRLAEKLLKARIEERITQKHKNTSAWVKHAKRFVQFDDGAKDAVNEQLALHQKLMQKMDQDAGEEDYERYGAGDNASDVSSEEDRVVDELLQAASEEQAGGVTKDRKAVTSLLWKAAEGEDNDGDDKSTAIAKARAELKEMKFMKVAREREEKEYAEQMDSLMDDIRRYQTGDDESETGTEKKTRQDSALQQQRIEVAPAGRKQYKEKTSDKVEMIRMKKQGGIATTSLNAVDGDDSSAVSKDDADEWSDSEKSEEEVTARVNPKAKNHAESSSGVLRQFAADRLAASVGVVKNAGKKSGSVSTRITVLPTSATKRERDADDEWATQEGEDDKSVDDNDANLQLHQEYLISRAFAHDDVDEEFLQEKQAQVEMIMKPQDKNVSLPGWGEWGGENPQLNQHHQEKLAHSTLQKEIERTFLMRSRADASLDHVIINHDGVELVPDRMTLHMVPRPFSNPQEFARSMRQPIGPEWSSALAFKDGVQPRVEVRQGHAVVPLDIALRQKKTKTKRRKVEKKRGATS